MNREKIMNDRSYVDFLNYCLIFAVSCFGESLHINMFIYKSKMTTYFIFINDYIEHSVASLITFSIQLVQIPTENSKRRISTLLNYEINVIRTKKALFEKKKEAKLERIVRQQTVLYVKRYHANFA